MRIADAPTWEWIESTFNEHLETLRNTRIPSREQWIGKTDAEPKEEANPTKRVWKEDVPHWLDPEVGEDVRAWWVGAYLDGIDMEHLEEKRQFAVEIGPKLERLVAAREATPEFINLWGYFCGVGEIFELLLISDNSDPHAARQAATRKEKAEARYKWLGHYLVQALDAGFERQRADQLVEKMVRRLLEQDKNDLTEEEESALTTHNRAWFKSFMSQERDRPHISHLRDTYRVGKFHESDVRAAADEAAEASEGLPSLKIKLRDL